MRRLFGMLLAVAALAGCNDDGLSPTQLQATRAQRTWQSLGLIYYTVEARISCFCAPGLGQWHELTVANDSVIAIRRVAPGEPEQPTPQPEWFSTVDEVFERVFTWPDQMQGNRVTAVFAEETGLPLEVNLITSPNIADGGATYYFRELKPGLTAAGALAAR